MIYDFNLQLVCLIICLTHTQHYHHFGDLLKMALARCREAQPTQWYKTIALSLQQVFLRLLEEGGGKVDTTDPQWADLRDLARRYSLPFSFDQLKVSTRQMLVGIHRLALFCFFILSLSLSSAFFFISCL